SVMIFFFFQAEDGIRDFHVTGVQTCALPISLFSRPRRSTGSSGSNAAPASCAPSLPRKLRRPILLAATRLSLSIPLSKLLVFFKIGRASCRERVWMAEDALTQAEELNQRMPQ